MIWLYRLQQRLSITRNESLAIVTLVGLLLAGMVVQQWQRSHTPPSDAQARVEAQFQRHVAGLPAPNRPSGASTSASNSSNGTSASTARRQASAADARTSGTDARIDLNTATIEDLQRLPGIGPALSQRIDAYRTAYGPFQRVDDLVRVDGIGEKTLADIRSMVVVAENKRP